MSAEKLEAVQEKPPVTMNRVLVMDDEEIVRDISGKILEFLGNSVEYACDGEEAVELYKKSRDSRKPFDVVIMDLTIPGGMGGKQAIGKLLKIDPEVKAIVSSGFLDDPVIEDYRKYGFRNYIVKPFNIGEMKEKLDKVLTETDG